MGPDYVSTNANNAHQEPGKGDGPYQIQFQLATIPIECYLAINESEFGYTNASVGPPTIHPCIACS